MDIRGLAGKDLLGQVVDDVAVVTGEPGDEGGGVVAALHRERRQLERGQRVSELMKQKQYAPMSVAEMALSLYAGNNGYFDKVDRRKVVEAEAGLQSFARSSYADLLKSINAKPDLSKEVEAGLKKCCEDFFATL